MPRECTKNVCWERKMSKTKCAKGSIRVKVVGRARRVLVRTCCPKGPGHWNGKKCKVGLRAQAIGKRR